jgi:multidrug efflux pump subunit AcrA (membrane-fusion protein)
MSSILNESDKILGIDEESVNDDFEDVLSALNSQYLTYSKSSYYLAKEKVKETEKLVVPLSNSFDKNKILEGGKLVQSALLVIQQHLYDMGGMLENTLAIGELTQTELDSFRSTISSKKSTVISSLSTVNNSIKAVDDAKTSYDSYLRAYEAAVDSLENTKKSAEVSELSARISLQNAQIDLEELKEPASDSELASARSQVTNAQSNVNKILYNIEQSTITTPIDGEVVLLNGKTGDIIVEEKNEPFCTILNKEYFYVETSIEEADISKIKVGQKAYVTIDALDESVVEGEVTFVSLTSEMSNGIVSYSIKVLLKNTTSLDIREGMSASVEFIISEVNNVLMSPVAAVKNINGKPSVYMENGDVREVITGFTDGKLVEIISGLSEGENVKY